jgi:small redox-active disulfide protein 2
MYIKILGPGCANCHRVEAVAREAVAQMGAEATFEKVEDFNQIMQYPIMFTPGLVINEELVCAGRIPRRAEVVNWVKLALSREAK